jgi:hypothetical protein
MDVVLRGLAHGPIPANVADQSCLSGPALRPAPDSPTAWEGRVEHVVSGQVTHFHALEELLTFMQHVLAGVQRHLD